MRVVALGYWLMLTVALPMGLTMTTLLSLLHPSQVRRIEEEEEAFQNESYERY